MPARIKYQARIQKGASGIIQIKQYFWWNIYSFNSQVMQTSETYTHFYSAWKSASNFADRHLHIGVLSKPDVTPTGKSKEIKPQMSLHLDEVTRDLIEIFEDVAGMPRWRIKAPNKRILTTSESYSSHRVCLTVVNRFSTELTNFRITDAIKGSYWLV